MDENLSKNIKLEISNDGKEIIIKTVCPDE